MSNAPLNLVGNEAKVENEGQREPRVYVTHDTGDDLADLEHQFGHLVYLSSGYVDVTRPAFLSALRDRIRRRIAESQPYDYIYFQGFGAVTALCVREWFLRHSEMHLIIRRRKDSRFIVIGLT